MDNLILFCKGCSQDLDSSCFSKANNTKRGFQYECKECQRRKNAQWQKDNKEKVSARTRKWQLKQGEKHLERRRFLNTGDGSLKVFKLNKETNTKKCSNCKTNKDKSCFLLGRNGNPQGKCLDCRREQWAQKMQNPEFKSKEQERAKKNQKKIRATPQGRIDARLSNAIWYTLKQNKSFKSWETLVGYTAFDLKNHLEKLFIGEMSWEHFLNGEIHIDHKIPKSWFKYTSFEDKEFQKCWALENLQPKWKLDNLTKNNKYAD